MFLSVNSVRQLRRVTSDPPNMSCFAVKEKISYIPLVVDGADCFGVGNSWEFVFLAVEDGRDTRQYIANSLEGSDTLENYTVNVYFSVRGYTCGDCDHKIVSIVSITVTELHLLQAHSKEIVGTNAVGTCIMQGLCLRMREKCPFARKVACGCLMRYSLDAKMF